MGIVIGVLIMLPVMSPPKMIVDTDDEHPQLIAPADDSDAGDDGYIDQFPK
ncbi:MAG: hypothetical protein KKB59_19865 [Spirochaetes bacterium]|nr:hypothetical protein [Spirochaetota bacterium]